VGCHAGLDPASRTSGIAGRARNDNTLWVVMPDLIRHP
jgi:hypothetical protein